MKLLPDSIKLFLFNRLLEISGVASILLSAFILISIVSYSAFDPSILNLNNYQQADTGTKMTHIGKNTRSKIISKGISLGNSQNTYRGNVSFLRKANKSRNYTQCDSLLVGNKCGAHTIPYIESKNNTAVVEHEASTSKINEEQLYYCRQRGLSHEEAVSLIVNGFCKQVLQELPMEFAVEAQKLVAISLEGSVG